MPTQNVDEEWLNGLKLKGPEGLQIGGFIGQGVEKVIIKAVARDGRTLAIKMAKPNIGFYIKELPSFMVDSKFYSITTLNEKLARIVGNVQVDQVCGGYNRLWTRFISLCFENSVESVYMSASREPKLAEFAQLVLFGESGRQRFLELSRLDSNRPKAWAEMVSVNHPHVITETASHIGKWARRSIAAIDRLPTPQGQLTFKTISQNPLIIWGAAILDGFINRQEVSIAAEFMRSRFGDLVRNPNTGTYILQAGAIMDAYQYWYGAESGDKSSRFQELCIALGIVLNADFFSARLRKP